MIKAGLVRKCSVFPTRSMAHRPSGSGPSYSYAFPLQTAQDLDVHWLRMADLAPTKVKAAGKRRGGGIWKVASASAKSERSQRSDRSDIFVHWWIWLMESKLCLKAVKRASVRDWRR